MVPGANDLFALRRVYRGIENDLNLIFIGGLRVRLARPGDAALRERRVMRLCSRRRHGTAAGMLLIRYRFWFSLTSGVRIRKFVAHSACSGRLLPLILLEILACRILALSNLNNANREIAYNDRIRGAPANGMLNISLITGLRACARIVPYG